MSKNPNYNNAVGNERFRPKQNQGRRQGERAGVDHTNTNQARLQAAHIVVEAEPFDGSVMSHSALPVAQIYPAHRTTNEPQDRLQFKANRDPPKQYLDGKYKGGSNQHPRAHGRVAAAGELVADFNAHVRNSLGKTNSHVTHNTDICKHFIKGHCRNGTSCRFLHEASPPLPPSPASAANELQDRLQFKANRDPPMEYGRNSLGKTNNHVTHNTDICKHFIKGHCRNGASCRFLHEASPPLPPSPAPATTPAPQTPPKSIPQTANSSPAPCWHFAAGNCHQGNNCPYSHVQSKPHSRPFASPVALAVNSPVASIRRPPPNFDAIRTAMFNNVVELQSQLDAEKQTLDLVLMLDCTGSMEKWLKSAQTDLCKIVDEVQEAYPTFKIQVGFIGYRDFSEGSNRLVVSPLTGDVNSVKHEVLCQKPFGGGDGPEDVDGALEKAFAMNWSAAARVIVLACDASCHGKEYHTNCLRTLPDGKCDCDSELSRQKMHTDPFHPEKSVAALATLGVDMYIIEIDPAKTRKMVERFKSAFEAAPVPADGIHRRFSSHTERCALNLRQLVVASASISVESSISRTSTLNNNRARVQISTLPSLREEEEDIPVATRPVTKTLRYHDWTELANSLEERAVRHTFVVPSSVMDWKDIDWSSGEMYSKLKHVKQRTTVRIDRIPFSAGAMRVAHAFLDKNLPQRKLVGKIYYNTHSVPEVQPASGSARLAADSPLILGPASRPREPEPAFLGPGSRPFNSPSPGDSRHRPAIARAISAREEMMAADTKMQTVCKCLAQWFSLSNAQLPKLLDFVTASYYELLDRPENDPFRFVAVEPYLDGAFVKYSNNNGWVNRRLATVTDAVTAVSELQLWTETAAAFSHFTWQLTNGQIMVTDLQGVGGILTDPQIHTKSGRGRSHLGKRQSGDIGEDGMTRFFHTHACNALCRCLALQPVRPQAVAAVPPPSSVNSATAAAALDTLLGSTSGSFPIDLSCALCGDVFHTQNTKYRDTILADQKQLYCTTCQNQIESQRVSIDCDSCPKSFPISAYWYTMVGMEQPSSCLTCRARGPREGRRK